MLLFLVFYFSDSVDFSAFKKLVENFKEKDGQKTKKKTNSKLRSMQE
jgi:hypothetical protein